VPDELQRNRTGGRYASGFPWEIIDMEGVGFIAMLVIGALAGWIAEKFTRSDHGLLTNVVVGIAGAFLGGFLASMLGIAVRGFWGALIAAVFGATVLILVFRALTGRGRTSS